MADEGKPPGVDSTEETTGPDRPVPAPEQDGIPASAGTPTSAATSDQEKTAKIEEAKARAAAAKEALAAKAEGTPAPAVPGAPKAPVKKKEEGPKPTDASSHVLVQKLKSAFNGAVLGASEFLGQLAIRIDSTRINEICGHLKSDQQTPFDYLSDLTCVHYPDNLEAPFEVVYNLYSIPANERVRLKVAVQASDGVESVTSIWPSANWLEREVFDLFGVNFRNHPDLRRILLPPDWNGHPLRKDYPLEFVENEWTENHLPEFTDVQREQLDQRRGYGLEMLSIPEERQVREIFRGDKEVMPKDK
ncbi:MAG: NADH-quinone oxidoreductase subunit [Blastocatellia bacterium]|jgi:NADH-quinone oxidoreductase subunit C|nr:NADH-quinone oxidoreductase subunit [Blastocatellia bacterium]